MVKSLKYIIILVAVVSIGFAQYRTSMQNGNNIFENQTQQSSRISSLFDPSRFSMNHSFSMSMLSGNNMSIGLASYTNNMNFNLRDNLRLQTYITFLQPKVLSSSMYSPYQNTQLYFDATLNYNPTPNTHLMISFGNYPQYRSYYNSPFLLNRYY